MSAAGQASGTKVTNGGLQHSISELNNIRRQIGKYKCEHETILEAEATLRKSPIATTGASAETIRGLVEAGRKYSTATSQLEAQEQAAFDRVRSLAASKMSRVFNDVGKSACEAKPSWSYAVSTDAATKKVSVVLSANESIGGVPIRGSASFVLEKTTGPGLVFADGCSEKIIPMEKLLDIDFMKARYAELLTDSLMWQASSGLGFLLRGAANNQIGVTTGYSCVQRADRIVIGRDYSKFMYVAVTLPWALKGEMITTLESGHDDHHQKIEEGKHNVSNATEAVSKALEDLRDWRASVPALERAISG